MDCVYCDDFGRCSSEPCPYHFLVIGAVKDLMEALEEGGLWGDIAYDEDAAALAAETPQQTAQRLMKVEKEEERGADSLKHYEMQKRQMLNVDLKTGSLKRKSDRFCRDAEEPAKWVVGKKKLGNYQEWAATDQKATVKPTKRPAGVPPHAIFWGYGCEPHRAGACPHLHPGDAGYADAKAGKKPNVEALLANACFLSSKSPMTARSSPASASTARSTPQFIDSW